MNEKLFSIGDFKTLILRILNAGNAHDGLALQKLEAEVIDKYKETSMSRAEYNTLSNMCDIFLDDWRRNWK